MVFTRPYLNDPYKTTPRFRLMALLCIFLFGAGGCKTSAHSSDARVKKIDEMLGAELPKGTSMAQVSQFLSARGYRIEHADKPQTMVAIVRHIDTDTLRPQNARVTFHFDAGDRLDSYELVASPDEPIHP
jgi:hypothetical protein